MSYIKRIEPQPNPFQKSPQTWKDWLNVRIIVLLWSIIILLYALQWMVLNLFIDREKRDAWPDPTIWNG